MRGKHILILTLCLGAWSVATRAQTIYRCGNSYSHTPCAGGSAMPTEPSPDKSAEQARRAQDANTRRDMRLAGELEKNRLREEAAQARAQRAADTPAAHGPKRKDDDEARAGSKKKPPYFTARPAEPQKDGAPPKKPKPANTGATQRP